MDKLLTPGEAWDDFWMNVKPAIWEGITPKERNALQQARRAAEGRVKIKGKIVPLGDRRLRAILEQYAPQRYTFEIYIRLNK